MTLVSRPGDSCHKSLGLHGPSCVASDARQNLIGGFGPDEGFGRLIMDLQVVADGRFQFFHTSKDSATYALIRDFCEPTLHEIDPGTISGREVEVKVRAFGKPVPNQRCFVRAVVIEHDMNVKLGGHIRLDRIQEPPELLRTMATVQLANDLSGL